MLKDKKHGNSTNVYFASLSIYSSVSSLVFFYIITMDCVFRKRTGYS